MARPGIFITVLLSLFMFQSLWNVAAAFCDHENTQNQPQQFIISHFGHHIALDCAQDRNQHQKKSSALDGYQSKSLIHDHQNNLQMDEFLNHLGDDHSDHLPSFAHFIVVDVQQQALKPKFIAYPETSFTDWSDQYQSPYLFLPKPPPVSTPL